jgi:hypothetical protein
MGRGEPGAAHPIMNEREEAWAVPGQVGVVPEPEWGQFEMYY